MVDPMYWIWLSMAVTPGSETFGRLRRCFATPLEIYQAPDRMLREALGELTLDLDRLTNKDLRQADIVLGYCHSHRISLLTYSDPDYPQRLRDLKNPPVLLYYVGRVTDMNRGFFVSVVGSREHDDYCRDLTFEITHDLSLGGAAIVSGLALGLDSVALAAAYDVGGKTYAVLGSGLDVMYPKEHRHLARDLTVTGAVMSEFPPGTPPLARNFPIRNRIISGLSHVVMVTGGTLKSGTLITARHAREQGKPIYAMPGDIRNPYCGAPLLLLREGAHAVTCAEDILYAYQNEFRGSINIFRLLEKHEYSIKRVLKEEGVASYSNRHEVRRQEEQREIARLADRPIGKRSDRHSAPVVPGKREGAAERKVASAPADEIRKKLDALDPFARYVYNRIPPDEPCTIDSIADAQHPVHKVLTNVTKLELAGLIDLLVGNRVRRRK